MIYRKRGSVVRWENGTVVHVAESGVAVEEGELFECWPEGEASCDIDAQRVLDAARAIHTVADRAGVRIERLLIIDGMSEHECDGVRWTDTTQRIHLSLLRARTRALLDLGSFATEDIERVAAVLARADDVESDAPPRLRLAPNVTAALLPALVGIAPPNVRLVQTAGGLDGRGAAIVEAMSAWPNWYRPSYRVRPVRMPLQLRIECDVRAIERDRPTAVALLAPVAQTRDGLVVRALIEDGARAFPAAVRIARIDAVAAPAAWYPYGGGSFGAEMML